MKKEGAEGREAEINALRKRMQNDLDGLSEGLQARRVDGALRPRI